MVHAIGYDSKSKELEVVFSSGSVWRYIGVPRKVFRELLSAMSIGQYMNDYVIGVYPEYEFRRR